MFDWLKKDKEKKAEAAAAAANPAQSVGAKPNKDELIRQAMLNTKAAREAIGEETLNKLGAMIEKKQRQMQLEKIRADIIRKMETNSGQVSDHLKFMLHDKKTDH
jgi:hypothetical protein